MRKLIAASVMMLLLFVGVSACASDQQDGYNAPAPEAQPGKLVKKPKIGGPGKPVIGKPKGQ